MRVGILTSSRADYGIYRPLIKAMLSEPDMEPELIVFGTHLSKFHGYTVSEIEADKFPVYDRIESLTLSDEPSGISSSFGLTSLKFAEFWRMNDDRYDLVFCLGDRFEMCAAVFAGIPFNIQFAHLHGGETTLGAIDNIYRHSISLASHMHFVSTDAYAEKLEEILGSADHIHSVGALSLDNLVNEELLSKEEFEQHFNIDLNKKSVLVTFHPETKERNDGRLLEAIQFTIDYLLKEVQVIVTMPNADTYGTRIRKVYEEFAGDDNLRMIENFGTRGYFTCMKHVCFIAGNSSSGIIEAASFGKNVINIGARQEGRISGENVEHVPLDTKRIEASMKEMFKKGDYKGSNVYGDGKTASRIISILKTNYHV